MLRFAPIFHILGIILAVLSITMLLPAGIDYWDGDDNVHGFLDAALITGFVGVLVSLATRPASPQGLSARQAYLLTALIWVLIPLFGALPFLLGAPDINFTDAYFEAVSGITTTGSTILTGLENLPRGVLLWRGMLNWMGGLGIAFVAMIFLPVMRVGGMQFFRTEGFDTLGKILPRARDISRALLAAYAGLTLLCALSYIGCGMPVFDASIHAMATLATGGFGTHDSSFGAYSGTAEYAGTFFMLIGGMPFIRFVQLARGQTMPLWRDPQVRALLRWFVYAVVAIVLWRMTHGATDFEQTLRETLFNLASIMTGTGFGSANVGAWGAFPVTLAFCLGMIGGCTGSSSGALSVFRCLALISAIRSAIQRLHSPHRMVQPRLDGKPLDEDVLNPMMMYFTGYILILGVLTVLISMTGVDMQSAVFAIWTSMGNIGFGFGPMVARTGTMVDFSDQATWIMTLAMLLGRLGLLAILVVFMPRFWRE
ncbi:TrkH family potassium uptake protein [Phaeovulum sp. W22_SRMD_FR3]|uniref:TrkH family potassium uptake protein n=1 Tax=Phaeovulum sp. W22_SRMD_FR3 TaxID=3240274 RepID=UPI003F9D5434